MKTLHWMIAGVIVLMAGMVRGELSPVQFSHMRDVTTSSQQEEIAALGLDGSSWELLAEGASDLCVFDAADVVLPHLLRRATAKRVRRVKVTCRSRVTGLRELPDNRIEIDLKLEAGEGAADTVSFATPLKDFERRVTVDGVAADGAVVRLVSDALIYDYTRFMDVRSVTVDLPRNDYRVLRITIDAVTDTTQSPRTAITRTIRDEAETQRTEANTTTTRPFRIDRANLHTHRDEARNRETVMVDYALKGWSVSQDERERTSTIEMETFHTPLTSLVIAAGARNFSRRATVLAPYQRDGREQWRQVGAATLSRISFRNFKREALVVTFPELQERRLRLVLHNGDAPPLAIEAVTGRGPVWQALFLAAPGQTYRLFLGGKHVSRQGFDTSHIERLLAREIAPRPFELGDVVANPAYDATAGRNAWAWLGSRAFFAIGIVLVVLVLGVGLVRAGKMALVGTSDEE
jgi:hypothetical protein